MPEKLIVKKINETWLRLDTELSVLHELEEAFQFYVPGYQHTPMFKNKVWDGKIRLVSAYKQKTYVGLYKQLEEFCAARGYEFVGYESDDTDVTPESLVKYVQSIDLYSSGQSINFRDYQYTAIYKALKHRRHLIQSPTGSGKSAQIYSIVRYLEDQGLRILLLVPTVGLVSQMKSDFIDYSTENHWDVESNVHQIYAGQEKKTKKAVVLSTWQSLQAKSKIPNEWFEQFDVVICDEVHLAKSKELTGIIEKCINASYRLGFTGSLDKSQTHKQMLISLFGETTKVATTRALIDVGVLSNIKIKGIVYHYTPETSKALKKAEYAKEMDFIVRHERRNNFIRNLALSLTGNTIVFFTVVEKHGQVLNDLITSKDPTRPVFYVHGGIPAEERESIRHKMEMHDCNKTSIVFDHKTFRVDSTTKIKLVNGNYKVAADLSIQDDIDLDALELYASSEI